MEHRLGAERTQQAKYSTEITRYLSNYNSKTSEQYE